MWTKATHAQLLKHRVPEIVEADLASLMLDMAQWGISDIQQLTWLTPPPKGHLIQANDTLHQLEALENGKITEHGKNIHQLPCHPRIAHMLLMAKDKQLLHLATDVAAILEERDPLPKDSGIDINLRIEALRRGRGQNRLGRKLARIEKTAESYRSMFKIGASNGSVDPYETGFLLVHAYPERIACSRPGNNAQFQLSNGKLAMAGHKDDLAWEEWLAIGHMDARDGMGKIFLASPLNPKDLAPLVKERDIIAWDTKKGGLIAARELRIGSIVLQSKALPNPDESFLIQAISEAIQKEGEVLLDFNEKVTQWQNRVLSLRKWHPEDIWPDVSTPLLLMNNSEWLSPYLNQVKKPEDLKKLNLLEILQNSLEWDKQKALEKLAPQKIKVPSGSFIQINYQTNGTPPVLAVRLQEVFGMETTPAVNGGNTPLLMHLLSPGFKPVQITSDLTSFWDTAYFEVKKELKRRYPKHVWPDNPREEQAIRGAKRKSK